MIAKPMESKFDVSAMDKDSQFELADSNYVSQHIKPPQLIVEEKNFKNNQNTPVEINTALGTNHSVPFLQQVEQKIVFQQPERVNPH